MVKIWKRSGPKKDARETGQLPSHATHPLEAYKVVVSALLAALAIPQLPYWFPSSPVYLIISHRVSYEREWMTLLWRNRSLNKEMRLVCYQRPLVNPCYILLHLPFTLQYCFWKNMFCVIQAWLFCSLPPGAEAEHCKVCVLLLPARMWGPLPLCGATH